MLLKWYHHLDVSQETHFNTSIVQRVLPYNWGLGSDIHGYAETLYAGLYMNMTAVFFPVSLPWRYSTDVSFCGAHKDLRCFFQTAPGTETHIIPGKQRLTTFNRFWYIPTMNSSRNVWGHVKQEDREFTDYEELLVREHDVHRWRWCATIAYVFRVSDDVVSATHQYWSKHGFGLDDFTIALQVRRGNIITAHNRVGLSFETYMDVVTKWLHRQPSYNANVSKVGVFVMSADPKVVIEQTKYRAAHPLFRFMCTLPDPKIEHAQYPMTGPDTVALLVDIITCASADFAVLSDHSNLGHLSAELIVAWHGPAASDRFCLISDKTNCTHVNWDD